MLASLLVSLAAPTLFAKPQVHTSHIRMDGWSIEKRADRFTGWVECSAHKGRMRLAGGAIIFDFGRSANTGQAIYRIDGGEARLAQNSSLARNYWNQHDGDTPLANPSGGVLALPAGEIVHARTIAIRINAGRMPQTFKVEPVQAVLNTESGLGCATR